MEAIKAAGPSATRVKHAKRWVHDSLLKAHWNGTDEGTLNLAPLSSKRIALVSHIILNELVFTRDA